MNSWLYDSGNGGQFGDAGRQTPLGLRDASGPAKKVYITGGHEQGTPTKKTEEYDLTTDTWSFRQKLGGAARYSSAAFSVGGLGYVVGGFPRLPEVEEERLCWSYELDTWTRRADAIVDIWSVPAVSGPLDGAERGIILGGELNEQTGNLVTEYLPSTNSWGHLPSVPGEWVKWSMGGTVGDSAYRSQGAEVGREHAHTFNTYRFSFVTKTWSNSWRTPEHVKTFSPAGSGLGSELMFCGGHSGSKNEPPGTKQKWAWKIDPVREQSWTKQQDMIFFPREDHAAVTLGDSLFVTGGVSSIGTYMDQVEKFSSRTGVWVAAQPHKKKRTKHSSFVL